MRGTRLTTPTGKASALMRTQMVHSAKRYGKSVEFTVDSTKPLALVITEHIHALNDTNVVQTASEIVIVLNEDDPDAVRDFMRSLRNAAAKLSEVSGVDW